MNEQLFDLIRQASQEKIDLIKRVIKFRPGNATDRGWSRYTGGMVDSGDWKIDVLLTVPNEILEAYIIEQEKEENDRKIEVERKSKLSADELQKEWDEEWQKQKIAHEQFLIDFERKLLWGK
jgi:hypothetical protein